MENIIRFAKISGNILMILRILVIVVSSIGICASLAAIVAADAIVEAANQSQGAVTITSGLLKMWTHNPAFTEEDLRMFAAAVMIAVAAFLIMALIAIRLLRIILNDMGEGRPFSQNMPSRIRQIAYMIFAYAVITPAAPFMFSYFMLRLFDIRQAITASPLVDRVEVNFHYGINLLAVLIGLIVILLSWVFEYGLALQRESDETL